ncbi:luciferin 4-monooxygenase-like [Ostrinia furnacalis]|uniref:luciferin 4-monooxygenase-like n=1 Tax=Ostrinia furnacalis TaxID=93504 RepID=UPI00103E01DE|nr:luciferin 4-monooxygenase-like [Ostrinia furnacalis]
MAGKSEKLPRRINYSALLYLNEVTSRVVAQTGIPSDRFHLGKLVLQSLKDDPDFILQIDGALGVSETNGSVLERSVRCATALRRLGVQRGDVMVFMAPNHLDLAIPFYAALYLGILIAGVDVSLGVQELEGTFEMHKPKVVFCQTGKASEIEAALKILNYKTQIVTFDKGNKFSTFTDLLQEYGDGTPVEDFVPSDFDPEETAALLTSTSGTTGLPKAAVLTHKNLTLGAISYMCSFHDFPTPTNLYLILSTLQWLTAGIHNIASPIFRYTRLQTSAPSTTRHIYDLINKFKPTCTLLTPPVMLSIVANEDKVECDLSCLETIFLAGNHVTTTLIDAVKTVAPQTDVVNLFGVSEAAGVVLMWDVEALKGSNGRVLGHLQYRLVDPETLEDIYEPDVPGELWLNGPSIFKGYYDNPKATKETFSEDGWFRTGDLLKRDNNHNYFFVDRIKTLLKYRVHQVSPVEVEGVIRRHPGVYDVVVIGVPDEVCGDLPAACVVTRSGYTVTAQEIKDLVKENLADSKQLRGGVVFMKQLPLTVTNKIDRRTLKKLVTEMIRE